MKKYGRWFETMDIVSSKNAEIINDIDFKMQGDYSVKIKPYEKAANVRIDIGRHLHNELRSVILYLSGDGKCLYHIGQNEGEIKLQQDFRKYEIAVLGSSNIQHIDISIEDTLWIDQIMIVDTNGEVNILKKTIDEIKLEILRTKKERINIAIREDMLVENNTELNEYFDRLWIEDKLDEVNQLLTGYFRKLQDIIKKKQTCKWKNWGIIDGLLPIMNLYFVFGSKGCRKLSLEAEDSLLDYLWDTMEYVNDINIAYDSVWYLNESENLDLGHKTACLLSSMIFKDIPKYKERLYPDLGIGFMGEKTSPLGLKKKRNIEGEHNAKEHYDAWCSFFIKYIKERAQKGFFLERASNGYMKWTLSDLFGIYNYIENMTLRKYVKQFLDLIWIDWAQEEINGIRGGVKGRHHYTVGESGEDSMRVFAEFLLGGKGHADYNYRTVMLGDYSFPDMIIKMALDREALGCFEYISHGITEDDPVLPRPAGTDYTLMVNSESRCVRYSYVTPKYILASPLEHPRSIYSHLAVCGRWMGLITGYGQQYRVVPIALDPSSRLSPKGEKYSTDLICNAVQDHGTLIFQQKRRWMQANPGLFPSYDDIYERNMGLYIGNEWDRMVQEKEVLFLQKGDLYISLRIILCKMDEDPLAWAKGTAKYADLIVLEEKPYTFEYNHTIIRLKSRYSPIILDMGEKKQDGSFEQFMKKVLNNKPTLITTVVKREAGVIIKYRGISENAKELIYNAANNDEIPMVNNEYVDYESKYTFNSPYLVSEFKSGDIELHFQEDKMNLMF